MLQHAFFPLNLRCILVNTYNSNFFVQTTEEAWVVWLYRNVSPALLTTDFRLFPIFHMNMTAKNILIMCPWVHVARVLWGFYLGA